MINSRLGLFTAADRSHTFSRSYGVILPSSLTRVRSLTLGYSPRLPVSVYGTGSCFLTRSFSWQCDIRNFATIISLPHNLSLKSKAFNSTQDSLLGHALPIACIRPSCVPPLLKQNNWYRNINLLSIAYAYRPRLRSRLTLGGRAFPRKPCHTVDRILTCLSLLIPAFSLLSAPAVLTIDLQRP